MRRAGRLLKLFQVLRRGRGPVTAEQLAYEVEVSVRTIYRDIAALIAEGAPIRGEAGVGYVLEAGHFLPPLMFTPDEIEALVIGMNLLEARADVSLATAARDVIAKIGAVIPRNIAPLLLQQTVAAPSFGRGPNPDRVDVADLRKAIRGNRKITLSYVDEKDQRTTRVIWPVVLAYFDLSRVLVAWCEMRKAFRHFRTDRMVAITVEADRYPEQRAKLQQAYFVENPHVAECLARPSGPRRESKMCRTDGCLQ